jgi:hypothetical protein
LDLKIKLDAIDYSDRTPTKTQIENMCNDMAEFLQKVGGSLLATGEFTIKEPFMQHLFNGASALSAAKEALGQNTSGIAVPRGTGPVPMQRQ